MRTRQILYSGTGVIYACELERCPGCNGEMQTAYTNKYKTVQTLQEVKRIGQRTKRCINPDCVVSAEIWGSMQWRQIAPVGCTWVHAERIDHLLLAVAIATLGCHELGEFVLKQGNHARCQVDPSHTRTLSLFQLGLRWLKRFLATALIHLPAFKAKLSNLRLKPVVIPLSQNSSV